MAKAVDPIADRKLRIAFWKYALLQFRPVIALSAVAIIEGTIKDLETLQEVEKADA